MKIRKAFYTLLQIGIAATLLAQSGNSDINSITEWDTAVSTALVSFVPRVEGGEWRVQNTNQKGQIEEYTSTYTMLNSSSAYIFESSSPHDYSRIELDTQLRVIRKESRILRPEIVSWAGYDQFSYIREGNTLNWTSVKENNKPKNGSIQLKPNGVEMGVMTVYLQALVLRGRQEPLKASLLMGKTWIDVEFAFYRSTQPTANMPAYQWPQWFTLQEGKNWYMCEMALLGPTRILYPHKQYFAFTGDSEAKLVAAWGGPPKAASFQIRLHP